MKQPKKTKQFQKQKPPKRSARKAVLSKFRLREYNAMVAEMLIGLTGRFVP